jgi:hypothetical protein
MSDESGVTTDAAATAVTPAPEEVAAAEAGQEAPASEANITASAAGEQPAPPAEATDSPVDPPPAATAAPSARLARVFYCDRGHRTTSLWSVPTTCKVRPLRSGPECGRQLFPVGQLPEQVVKALNPLKASKKAAKKH